MQITNRQISDILNEFADILELKGVDFKPRAYRNAARSVNNFSGSVYVLSKEELKAIDGIGTAIANKIIELRETGTIEELEELRDSIPTGLIELLKVEGVGPKTAKKLFNELNVSSVSELKDAAKNNKIRGLSGFGKKSEQNILEAIEMYEKYNERSIRGFVQETALTIIDDLKKKFDLDKIETAGSIRRRKPTVGDVDILVEIENAEDLVDYFVSLDVVQRILAKGSKKCSIITKDGLQVDLRIVSEGSFAAHLQYFTGSKNHNIKLRNLAIDQGYKLNEYGLEKDNKLMEPKSEEEIYSTLGLSYIDPLLREDRGEIEAAKTDDLPTLLKLSEIKGDFHTHTTWSEGSSTLGQMVDKAKKLKYEYIVITDHTIDLAIANGMSEERLNDQIQEIKKLNEEIDNIEVLAGAELNIRNDGSLDISDEVLSNLDFTIASIHSGFNQSIDQVTDRVITAIKNPHVRAIAHPTGRLLNRRDPLEMDLDQIIETAIDQEVYLELNGSPERMDLDDSIAFKYRNSGVKFILSSDAHHTNQMSNMQYALDLANRAWLNKDQIVNFHPVKHFIKS